MPYVMPYGWAVVRPGHVARTRRCPRSGATTINGAPFGERMRRVGVAEWTWPEQMIVRAYSAPAPHQRSWYDPSRDRVPVKWGDTMRMRAGLIGDYPIPDETARVPCAAVPKGNLSKKCHSGGGARIVHARL